MRARGARVLVLLAAGACADQTAARSIDAVPDAAAPAVDVSADLPLPPDAAGDPMPEVERPPPRDAAPPPDARRAEEACRGGGCPTDVARGHLKLWLRADVGVECLPDGALDRVASWSDASGEGRHARTPAGVAGPLCAGSARQIGGRQAISFPAAAGRQAHEHLEVDLGFLANAPFTIAVVERRMGTKFASFFLGSVLPYPDSTSCRAANRNEGRALLVGYGVPTAIVASVYDWGDLGCEPTADVPTAPAPNTVVVVGQRGGGITIFVNGARLAARATTPLVSIGVGLIGRAYPWNSGNDTRYSGDIAEIVAYDTALDDEGRQALETYLRRAWQPAM